MIAILSATEDDFYAMPLPFAVYSWARIGVSCIVFVPSGNNPKLALAKKYCDAGARFYEFKAEEKRVPTYSQVSRLFGATIPYIDPNEVLITGDGDMAVFSDYFKDNCDNENINLVGVDLTPADQIPMCYISMPVYKWKQVFGIDRTMQEHVSELIDPIEGLNIRGEQWSYDQWYAKNKIDESGLEVVRHNRARPGTQFAGNRVDRDDINWRSYVDDNLIDAHIWRPLTDYQNFQNLIELFKMKFPNADFSWAHKYRDEYLKLTNHA